MGSYATKDDIKDLQVSLDQRFDDVMDVLQTFIHQVDERFNRVEKDIADIKASIDRLTNTIDGFVKRLDEVETEQTARDAQFARLVEWAREVSKKTGIPLKEL